MPKSDAVGERAARLIESLRQQREQGTEYPVSAGRLRELADPAASDEALFKALAKAGLAVALAGKKDTASPVALAEDSDALARSDGLLTYALSKLASAERPLHPAAKIVAKVDRSLQPAFEAALTERLASGALPAGVGRRDVKGKTLLYLDQFPPPPPPAPKKSPEQALAEQILEMIAGQRDEGAPFHSQTDLARRLDPPPTDETLTKLARHKALKGQAIFAVPGRIDAPLARPGDEERLAQSPELLRYAVSLLSTAERPLHPLSKVIAQVDRPLRAPFEAAVRQDIEESALPAEVAVHDVGGKPHLRLARHEIPPTAEEALARRLLASLDAARNTADYPVPLDELLAQVAADTPPKVVKAALAQARDRIFQLAVGDAGLLVVLADDRDRLLGDPRVLIQALEAARTDTDQVVPIDALGKKLPRVAQDEFTRTAEGLAREGRLPPGVGCLWIKKRPHLFLLADMNRWPAERPEPSAEGPDTPAETAPPPVEATEASSDAAAPLAWDTDFGRLFDAVYERLASERSADAPVSLVQLRQEVPVGRDEFDSELIRLWQAGRYTLTGAGNGDGLSNEERAAGIEQQGDLLLYVSRQQS